MKYLIIFMCFVLCGCSLKKNVNIEKEFSDIDFIRCQCKIIDIKELKNTFKFTALNEQGDTIFLVSTKKKYCNIKKQSNRIYVNEVYDFILIQEMIRVSSQPFLGGSFIVENDIIFDFPSYNPQPDSINKDVPKVYFILNAIGLAHYKNVIYCRR